MKPNTSTPMANSYIEKLSKQNYIEPEMIEAAFAFWFNDNGHIRSPFPVYIHNELKEHAVDKILSWAKNVDEKAKKEINEEILAEKFEELLFEAAVKLVKTEDEKLTLLYPFMPRLGDKINKKEGPNEIESVVISRVIENNKDEKYLKVTLETIETKDNWDTKFELPA